MIAFTTDSIYRATQPNVEGDIYLECRLDAFFIENVGMSAWGLAIHKEARLIAVSANTHEITVFAFALGPESSPESVDTGDDISFMEGLGENTDWNTVEGPYDPEQRSSRNLIIHLTAHEANIPNIAFCNSDADKIGQWLVSTDIEGQTSVWDIWQQKELVGLRSVGAHRKDRRNRYSSDGM